MGKHTLLARLSQTHKHGRNDLERIPQSVAGCMLALFLFFQERVRRCIVYYFLEDDTISVSEPKQDNSGIAGQGALIKRLTSCRNLALVHSEKVVGYYCTSTVITPFGCLFADIRFPGQMEVPTASRISILEERSHIVSVACVDRCLLCGWFDGFDLLTGHVLRKMLPPDRLRHFYSQVSARSWGGCART